MFEEDTSPPPPPPPGASKSIVAVLALVVAALAGGGYYWNTQLNQNLSRQISTLQQTTKTQAADLKVLRERLHISAAELARLRSTAAAVQQKVSQTQSQLDNTRQTLAQTQQQTASEIAAVQQDTGNKLGAINGQIGSVKTDVSTNHQEITKTQADLEAAKAQLKSAIGDLGVQSGLIATTRSELDVLEKSGQRSYFEFKLTKTKKPVRVGPIELRLRNVNVKHEHYTVDVYADDTKVQKKNKTLNEPVQFIVGSNHALDEMVVYRLEKNTIIGYISTPKYTPAQVNDGHRS